MPVFVQNVLKNVPYATLGALIVPGIFLISEDLMFGIIGAIAATLIAFSDANVIVVEWEQLVRLFCIVCFLLRASFWKVKGNDGVCLFRSYKNALPISCSN